ncbi:MAG: non-hydrolyzing UDP-N-acetylglucosamine 2-epimerase [Cytophagaceae bacterium]
MKIITVLGARPQFIKASVVSKLLKDLQNSKEIIVHTGQHYDNNMSSIFFKELEIPKPKYHLGIGSDTHGTQTGRMLEAIEDVLFKEKPDCVMVYGDTNSTLAGALAAVKLHIPLAHVEAGLRSFNRKMPEEINRVLTDHAADILFAPTLVAVKNLLNEGIANNKIHFVGDVMYDIALYYAAIAEQKSRILDQLDLKPKSYILATIHRAENTDNDKRLRVIFEGLIKVSRDMPIILPLHPRTRKVLGKLQMLDNADSGLRLIEPLGYMDMVMLEKNARLIATDSGGIQKEAFFYRVPCVTLRDETEWVELVELGWNRLAVPDDSMRVAQVIRSTLDSHGDDGNPYGNGHSAELIVKILLQLLGSK